MISLLSGEFFEIINDDGQLLYFENYSDKRLEDVILNVVWRQDFITMFGKTHPQPRLTAWYGDAGVKYSYSGIKMIATPWTPVLYEIKQSLETKLETKFNSVLINYYRDGNDHMSYHSDDEKELGHNPVIASISYGDTRIFQLKHKFNKEKKTIALHLLNGSLAVMKGELQHFWQHKITRTKKPVGPRLNLTFRYVHGPAIE